MNTTVNPVAVPELVTLLDRVARLAGQKIHRAKLNALQLQIAQAIDDATDPLALFLQLWATAALDGSPARVASVTPASLPMVVFDKQRGWGFVTSHNLDGSWRGEDARGQVLVLAELDSMLCLSVPSRALEAPPRLNALQLVRRALWQRKGIFGDAVLATALVSMLALATSLYAMQVYDRVIPNHGYQTLWVLSVGVGISILMEFGLKQLRSHSVDKVCNAIDHELSEWFFRRMMGIRMEARPASVGTLASQVKGFELVRGVLTSTSLFVLTDVPFSLFFLAVISMVGGILVVVPLLSLPIGLLLGLVFQGVIQRHTRQNMSASNRKAGLLVEAVDGVESVKANGAEWSIQGRWNRLVAEAGAAEHGTRSFNALSQNLTLAFQQISYIALVAFGAYLVAENRMTMGGLIACSIIGSRAMTPMVQLPGVMVQWAMARAALDGLDQIISLPNEADDAHKVLLPQSLRADLRLERARFAYGAGKRVAFEVQELAIGAGERVGLVGSIGSGKTTLLKMLSGLYRPSEGRIFLGGVDMASLAPGVARESIGYLPQEVRLFSGSLRDNLTLGLPDPGDEAILEAAKRTGLIQLVLGQPAGLALELTESGRGVSGGQKQLIALTRLLLAKPRVWLLDEPTGAMDASTESLVVNLLQELARAGATLIITTHKTALLPILDRLLVLHEGRVQVDGPRDAVIAKISGKSVAPSAATAKEAVA
jgi:ATP-binding cassette, subfamily C, bacterial LapB